MLQQGPPQKDLMEPRVHPKKHPKKMLVDPLADDYKLGSTALRVLHEVPMVIYLSSPCLVNLHGDHPR